MFSDEEDNHLDVVQCNTLRSDESVMLRRPSDEEIAQIIEDMVSQVKRNYNLRNRVVGCSSGSPSGIFIKKTKGDEKQAQNKQKVTDTANKTKLKKNVNFTKPIVAYKVKAKPLVDIVSPLQEKDKGQRKDNLNVVTHEEDREVTAIRQDVVVPKYVPIDMRKLLSQIIVKNPLLEMMRIEEHKVKALSWVKGAFSSNTQSSTKANEIVSGGDSIENQCSEIISEIPQIYLDANAANVISRIVDPFFLSLIVNGKLLRNCMIDSGASNTIMPIEIMRSLGLKVDSPHGRCQAMYSREVPIIGTIKALPYRLTTFPDKLLTMSVLVVDIPPHYGMLFSRKWSAQIGGSIQCDLSFATFNIDGDNVKVSREGRTPHMIEINDDHLNCCVDVDIENFKLEEIVPLVEEIDPLAVELKEQQDGLGQMYFDGAFSKEGLGARFLFISPSGTTFKYSFSLTFQCTNNTAKYEALSLGLNIAIKHGIKCLKVFGDSELVVAQV